MPQATIQAAEHLPAPRLTAWLFPIAVLLAALTATFFLWRAAVNEAFLHGQTRINDRANDVAGQIRQRLQ